MKQYLIHPNQAQYRANLHSHSTFSDGHLTPAEMKAAYKEQGYSILCVSDHEYPMNHSALTEDDFLMLTGYEVYVRGAHTGGKCLPYEPEVHLNLFAKEPDNETYICYDYPYAKYIRKTEGRLEQLRRAGSEEPRQYTVDYVNRLIKTAVDNGYLVGYNHPVWSLEDEATSLAYENCFSLEICNYGAWASNRMDYVSHLYFQMLRHGKRMFCHAGDDNHNHSGLAGSFGAWTMILAKDLTYKSVIEAMEAGDMYASNGPSIYELSLEDGTVHLECSPAERVVLYNGSKKCPGKTADPGVPVTSADLSLAPDSPFFFVAVIDERGRIATSRGYFCDELKA